MTGTQFIKGWRHFCDCIDFDKSFLDAEAIMFMNEMPAAAAGALARVVKCKSVRRCRVCGCTDAQPCPNGCSWVEDDLCSRCV